MALVAFAMAIACVPCAVSMWRVPSARAARMLVGMSLGMALLHAAVLLGDVRVTAHSHGVTATLAAMSSAADPFNAAMTTHAVPILLAIALDFPAAMLAASWIRRRSSWSPGCPL